MPTLRSSIMVLAILLLAGCAFDSQPVARRTDTLTSDAPGASPLVVLTRNGNVEVIGDSVLRDVLVTAHIKCAGSTDQEAMQRLAQARVDLTRSDDGLLQVEAIFPEPINSNDSASIQVRLPQANGVEIKTSNGNIIVENVSGRLVGESSNGEIAIRNHRGDVHVKTSNGSVEAQAVAGAITVRTSNGSINAIDVGSPADLHSSNGSVTVKLASSGKGPLKVHTSNGSITASVASAFAGKVSLQTSNGGVDVNASGTAMKVLSMQQNSGSFVLGDAAHESALTTSNGKIEFEIVN